SIIVVNSIFGPLSSFAVSKYSQNKRFNHILTANGMLENNKVIKNSDIDKKSEKEINNIIYYFDTNHRLSDIKVLDKDFRTEDMEEVFGFSYEEYPIYPYDREEYFYLDRRHDINILKIEDYDYFIDTGYEGLQVEDTIDIGQEYNLYYKEGDIELIKGDKLLLSQNIESLAIEVYDIYKVSEDNSEERDIDEMSFEIENQ